MMGLARLAVRIVGGLALAALLMLPTIVGAMSGPLPATTGVFFPDACGEAEDEADMPAFEPGPRTVSACLELLPEQSGPPDDADLPSAHEARAAHHARRAKAA